MITYTSKTGILSLDEVKTVAPSLGLKIKDKLVSNRLGSFRLVTDDAGWVIGGELHGEEGLPIIETLEGYCEIEFECEEF